jgi:hypothetical protein
MWRSVFDAFHTLRQRDRKDLWDLCRHAFKKIALFGAGFACAFAPHVTKNLILLGPLLGELAQGAYFAPATTLRILMSYPLALTYGNYWAQLGTLSPLILAFAPLVAWLPRPARWRDSRLAALGFSTVAGIVLWMVLFPSIFMPRYFLASLLMCDISAAAGADMMSRRYGVLRWIIPAAVGVTILATPDYSNRRFLVFDTKQALHYPTDENEECLISSPYDDYCAAHMAINAAASLGDRVFLFAYNRLWLRPDLLQRANTRNEYLLLARNAKEFWAQCKARKFRFLLFDDILFKASSSIFESVPEGTVLRELYRANELTAWEIIQ